MYEILLPVDRARDRAVNQARYAERLASTGGEIEVTVLYVVSPNEFEEAGGVAFSRNEAAVDAADVLEDTGVTLHRVVDEGPVSERIVRAGDDREVDEIVMGGRKRSGVTQVLLGSTVHDVLVSTDRAVTVTGAKSVLGEGTRQVLVPVDRDVDRALQQATYVSNLPKAKETVDATVLFVFPHQDYEGAPPHQFAEVDAAVGAADHLADAGVSVERVAVGGEVTKTILETATKVDADGIVTGGRKRSGVQKVLLGSTALDVMLGAERPVTLTG